MSQLTAWPEHYRSTSTFDLTRNDGAGDDPRALRAFGYLRSVSAFSQRTINESAGVAAMISAQPLTP